MSENELNPELAKLYENERNRARKFVAEHCKATGAVTWLDDGKDEVFLRLQYPDLVTLLAQYGIERLANAVTEDQ